MKHQIEWFETVLTNSIRLYFNQPCELSSIYDIPPPEGEVLEQITGLDRITFRERVVLMLALMPDLAPQVLDLFFVHNKLFDRPYTEFGGWKGVSHGGFLPTAQTALFILTGCQVQDLDLVMPLFEKEHRFNTHNILHVQGAGQNEPFLSGRLIVSPEILGRAVHGQEFKPDYSALFPARMITTSLQWNDMVLDYQSSCDIEQLNTWIANHKRILDDWGLARFLKPGYRALFYGPPGTGKTLAATLIGKRNGMDVYRIDLSMLVSKYIGETEKNLARVFDMAQNRNWILFFDEAESIFSKRTSNNTSNDRHANQEVAYLLQRVEDFPGIVILASNLRSNIDEAFLRRFQSIIYFPVPNPDMRTAIWKNMLPEAWLDENSNNLIKFAVQSALSGGYIANVVRRVALLMIINNTERLNQTILTEAINKELLNK